MLRANTAIISIAFGGGLSGETDKKPDMSDLEFTRNANEFLTAVITQNMK